MRVSTTVFLRQPELPAWLRAFQRQLKSGGEGWSPDLLPLSALLAEVDAVADGVLLGHGVPRKLHWDSLGRDFMLALDQLGRELNGVICASAASLRNRFVRGSGAPGTSQEAAALRADVRALRGALRRPSTLQAAWDDALAGYECAPEPEAAEWRMRLLRDAAEAGGHGWKWLPMSIANAIGDDYSALLWMGAELSGKPAPRARAHEKAGLPVDRRLQEVRHYLGQPPAPEDLIGWVCFENAFIDSYLEVGPAEFFRGDACPDALVHGRWRKEGRVPECQDRRHETFLPDAQEGHRVLVRVRLGTVHRDGAEDRERALAATLVRVADRGSSWRLMDGAAIVRDNSWSGAWIMPAVSERMGAEASRHLDTTGPALREIDSVLVTRITGGSRLAGDVLSDFEWVQGLREVGDPAQRLALAIRVLERRLPSAPEGGPGWLNRAIWWLRDWWALEALQDELADAATVGLAAMPDRHDLYPEHSVRLRKKMLPGMGGTRYAARPGAIIETASLTEPATGWLAPMAGCSPTATPATSVRCPAQG